MRRLWWHVQQRIRRPVRLDSPAGASLSVLLILTLPVFLTVLAVAVDGLMLVAAERRATAMASIGVQAGVASVDFSGGVPALTGGACAIAVRAACDNVEGGCRSGVASAACAQNGNRLSVQVRLRAPHVLRGGFGLRSDAVQVTVEGEPGYGVNTRE